MAEDEDDIKIAQVLAARDYLASIEHESPRHFAERWWVHYVNLDGPRDDSDHEAQASIGVLVMRARDAEADVLKARLIVDKNSAGYQKLEREVTTGALAIISLARSAIHVIAMKDAEIEVLKARVVELEKSR